MVQPLRETLGQFYRIDVSPSSCYQRKAWVICLHCWWDSWGFPGIAFLEAPTKENEIGFLFLWNHRP